jgi:hypothetical protein
MFAPDRRPGQFRRVVSGFNAEGKSVIAEDKIIDSKPMHDGRDFLSTIWTTAESPANVLEEGDGGLRELPGLGITSPGGVLVRYHELQAEGGPGFHSNPLLNGILILVTRSVDFGIILEGQVELELDDGSSTVLRAGAPLGWRRQTNAV